MLPRGGTSDTRCIMLIDVCTYSCFIYCCSGSTRAPPPRHPPPPALELVSAVRPEIRSVQSRVGGVLSGDGQASQGGAWWEALPAGVSEEMLLPGKLSCQGLSTWDAPTTPHPTASGRNGRLARSWVPDRRGSQSDTATGTTGRQGAVGRRNTSPRLCCSGPHPVLPVPKPPRDQRAPPAAQWRVASTPESPLPSNVWAQMALPILAAPPPPGSSLAHPFSCSGPAGVGLCCPLWWFWQDCSRTCSGLSTGTCVTSALPPEATGTLLFGSSAGKQQPVGRGVGLRGRCRSQLCLLQPVVSGGVA